MIRSRTLLACLSAFAVLLHSATAAASIWCAMSGSLSVSCVCETGTKIPEGPVLKGVESCCSEAIEAQQTQLHELQPLPTPMAALPWEQVVFEEPEVSTSRWQAQPACTSPPHERLASTVIIR